MPIYTRTGDKGKTTLFNGQRVSKGDLRIDTLGTIDELNSAIGVVLAETQNSKLKTQNYNSKLKSELIKIQNDLLSIGSALANPKVSSKRLTVSSLSKRVKEFEDFIDKMMKNLPPLSSFILPGGGKTGATLHLARAICRRAERRIVELNSKEKTLRLRSGQVDNSIIIYFNRLSDLLFTLARFANFKEKKKEIVWSKRH
ncbi:MAG: ATP:cob(I)alamin adenosyltransferase [Candidatus Levybacteria bacterium RIFCSPLOWO2_01_FULL_39_24]|nr:MAG: ATP:cob(I)alamin adenosyltransferase [Candidatus Levybacteria bacterium RIFCSPHIGHO2_01_FULL_40_16]OGH45837.1 MAG: ATP:cob(I)alamin adenosyltransferase [Candidatus Levybacteria bacterium RIFCSPLOWO2_01_FULL_39_24]